MTHRLATVNPLGVVLFTLGALLLALCLIRYLRDQARQRELQGSALALLGLPVESRSPLLGPGLLLLVAGAVLLRGGWR